MNRLFVSKVFRGSSRHTQSEVLELSCVGRKEGGSLLLTPFQSGRSEANEERSREEERKEAF